MGFLIAHRGHRLLLVNTERRSWRTMGDPDWQNLEAFCCLGKHIFALDGSTLYRFDLDTETWDRLGPHGHWKESVAMCVHGDLLYAISEQTLWAIRPDDGKYRILGRKFLWPGEAGEVFMCSGGEDLWIIQGDRLFRVNAETGQWIKYGRDYAWAYTTAMCTLGDRMFAVRAGALYEIRPSDGLSRMVDRDGWTREISMAGNEDGLFLIQGMTMYRVDLDTDEVDRFSPPLQFDRTTGLISTSWSPSETESEEAPTSESKQGPEDN